MNTWKKIKFDVNVNTCKTWTWCDYELMIKTSSSREYEHMKRHQFDSKTHFLVDSFFFFFSG